jgi:hypothetical protein
MATASGRAHPAIDIELARDMAHTSGSNSVTSAPAGWDGNSVGTCRR